MDNQQYTYKCYLTFGLFNLQLINSNMTDINEYKGNIGGYLQKWPRQNVIIMAEHVKLLCFLLIKIELGHIGLDFKSTGLHF